MASEKSLAGDRSQPTDQTGADGHGDGKGREYDADAIPAGDRIGRRKDIPSIRAGQVLLQTGQIRPGNQRP